VKYRTVLQARFTTTADIRKCTHCTVIKAWVHHSPSCYSRQLTRCCRTSSNLGVPLSSSTPSPRTDTIASRSISSVLPFKIQLRQELISCTACSSFLMLLDEQSACRTFQSLLRSAWWWTALLTVSSFNVARAVYCVYQHGEQQPSWSLSEDGLKSLCLICL